jgi:hypothetical protein
MALGQGLDGPIGQVLELGLDETEVAHLGPQLGQPRQEPHPDEARESGKEDARRHRQTTAGSSGVPDHFVMFSAPSAVMKMTSSWRTPISPGM